MRGDLFAGASCLVQDRHHHHRSPPGVLANQAVQMQQPQQLVSKEKEERLDNSSDKSATREVADILGGIFDAAADGPPAGWLPIS